MIALPPNAVTDDQSGTAHAISKPTVTLHPQIMSYAGPVQGRSARRPTSIRPSSAEAAEAMEWKHVAIFGAGLALGISLGAGVALLTAPQSGAETRAGIRRGARNAGGAVRGASGDAWEGVQAEMRRLARALRRRRARRAAEQSLKAESTELP